MSQKSQKRKRTKATKRVKDVSKPQLLVLGMHRSGTSLVTRLINLMGAWVGEPEKVANPAPDNPRGFWEYPEVKELNDWLLAECGASWALPLCDLSDIPNGVRLTFNTRASAIVGELNVHRPWVLKDPRLCFALPLWLDQLDMPIGVHVYRPPIEVALSLEHRNGLPLSHGIALWEFYNRRALASTSGMPRVLVSLPDLRKDPLSTIGRFYEDLIGVGVNGLIMPEVAEIEAFIDLNFLHFQEPRETAALMLNAAQLELVHAFESAAAFELPNVAELSEGARNVLVSQAYSKTVSLQKPADGLGADAGGKLEKLQEQVSLVLESHQAVAAQLAGLEQMLVRQAAQIESVNKRLGEQEQKADLLAREATAHHQRQTAVLDNLERKLAEQQRRQLEYANHAEESARLRAALAKVAADSVAIRGSWRWRLGNSGVRCVEWLLRRDPVPGALESIEATSRQFGFAEFAPKNSVAPVAGSGKTESAMTASARAEQQLQAVHNSMSWRITAPLRAVYGAFERPRSFVAKALDAREHFGGWISLSRQTFGVLRQKGLRGLGEDIRRYHEFHPSRSSGGKLKPQSTKVPTSLHPARAAKTEAVLCFPIIDWDFRFQRPQQLMRMFAQHEQQVIYVALRFGDVLSARPIESGITELTLPAPAGLNPYRQLPDVAANDNMLEALQSYLEQYVAGPLTIIVQLPFWRDLAMRIADRRGGVLVYDCMDDHAGFSTNEPEMLEAEEELIRGADLVVASSELLLKKVQKDAQQSLLLRNACDFEHFASVDSPPNAKNGEIVVGYYGAIADWFDSDLVHDIAKMRPRWRFQLIGSTYTGDVAKLKKLGNVELLGEQPYSELPELIAGWHACIIPFRKLPLTEATNPVKVYEMLAAGKPVVAVPLSELTPIAEEGIIAVAESPVEFVRQIESEVRKGDKQRAIGRKYAEANTWEMRHQGLTAALRLLEPLVSIIIVTFHNLELNRLCLESVLADTNYGNIEVIVVDNASEDDTPTYLQELERSDPRVRVILNDQNRGFAGANNQGLAIARGQYLCLLNNDTVVSADWLSNLIMHLKRRPDLGLVGPVTNAIGNEAKIEVGYESLSDMSSWARQYTQSHQGVLEEISMLAMFCVVMPRYVWQRVGSLDERFGIGMFEDDDYNRRVREAGYHYGLARDSFVHHWQKSSFKLLGEGRYLKIFEDNQKKFHAKWSEQLGEEAIKEARLKTLRERSAVTAGTVIFAPSVGWGIHLFQRPHHLARLFAKMGYLVIFDCSNAYDDVDLLKEIEPNLFLFRGEPELLHGLPRTLLWTFSYNYDYCDHFPADTRVLYDWIDDLAVFPYDQEKLAHLHERGLAEADLVASVAQQLHRQALKARPDAIYLPNAVEQGRFEIAPSPNPARDDNDLRGFLSPGTRVAGYYGALAEWFDYDLLARVAKLRPDWRFLLIGPDYDQSITNSQIKSVPNIRWIGPRDYDVLPGFLHLFDVAMIPFQINDITLATSPLKLFEYFAGGRPVISTPMPECAAFDEVLVVQTAEEFSDALEQAVASGMDPDFQARLVSLTAENTWRARVETVIAARNDLGDRHCRKPVDRRRSGSLPQLKSAANTLGDAKDIEASLIDDAGLSEQERALHKRFIGLLNSGNRSFYRALLRHLQSLCDHPCLEMYFTFALSSNDRGRQVAGMVANYINAKGKRYLDVGCAYGGFLVAFGEFGAEPTGIDLTGNLLDLARENFRDAGVDYPLVLGDFTKSEDLAKLAGPFEIITCNDVIEHVADPEITIRHISQLLADDGIAYFEIPNAEAVSAVVSDGHYRMFALTLLEQTTAVKYFSSLNPGVPYGVEHMLSLQAYQQLFEANDLEMQVLPESFSAIDCSSVDVSLAALEIDLPELLGAVPDSVRAEVTDAVKAYLEEAHTARDQSARRPEDFLLRYGAEFWKILARKS